MKTPGFPIKFSKTPSTVDRGAPLAGEHTREVLAEAGYDAATIDRAGEGGSDRRRKAMTVRAIARSPGTIPGATMRWQRRPQRLDPARDALAIAWDKQPLEGFESHPIADLCSRYDLVVLDHPHVGEAVEAGCLQPLEDVFEPSTSPTLQRRRSGRACRAIASRKGTGRCRSTRRPR